MFLAQKKMENSFKRNWIEEDKILLQELIKERVSAIENKNRDTNTNQRKKKSWLEIEESFNNLCKGCTRSLSQLKSQWTITKLQAKKEVSSHRREMNKTGGGPQPPEKLLSENDITVWLPNEFVIDTNEFDSDLVSEKPPAMKNSSPAKMKVSDENEVEEVIEVVETKASGKKKMRPMLNHAVANEQIKEVVAFDIRCREELHQLQVENEQKKSRNLDLKYKILKEKYASLKEARNKQLDNDKDD